MRACKYICMHVFSPAGAVPTHDDVCKQAAEYEEELLEDLVYAEEASGGGIYHPHGHASSSTYAPHPLVQALVAANDAVARVELQGCLQGALGAARALAGEAAFDAAVRAVHPAVAEQMQRATTAAATTA